MTAADASTSFVVAVFCAVYVGMALGRWPGLKIDRTGIAILGGIVLYTSGEMAGADVLAAIDWATITLLFGLMILSAQFAVCGFYGWCSARIAAARASPAAILALTVLVSGLLSAVLTNDVVVFAMTPMLIQGLAARGLDARPYLIALAGGANAGSAATLIGNPQNILIGQAGRLDFWEFTLVCTPPALLGLVSVFAVVWLVWRRRFTRAAGQAAGGPGPELVIPSVDRFGMGKAVLAAAALLAMFATHLPHVTGVLIIAGLLLLNRQVPTRDMLGFVDWHLLALFAGLFVVTAALARTGLPAELLRDVSTGTPGWPGLAALVPLTLVGSNTIGNVPIVVLLLAVLKSLSADTLYALAVLSTLAGNLLVVGSLANIIVVERARQSDVALGFAEHARCGVPMTLLSIAGAVAWLAARPLLGL
ncbi:MAG: SLC13 family permease [Rhodospirillales bacterium]